MPTLNEVYQALTRAIRAETEPDPNPDSPLGPNARLSGVASVIADEHAAEGTNRDRQYPSIEVAIATHTRVDDGGDLGIWRGQWSYDDAGHRVGRIFEKDWRTRFQLSVYVVAHDDTHDVGNLNDALELVLTRYDTAGRNAFLKDTDGTPLQNIEAITDEGGSPRTGQRNLREFEREVTIEYTRLVDEAEQYGPTPRIARVITPTDGESHGWSKAPETVEGGIRAQADTERVEAILVERTSGQ